PKKRIINCRSEEVERKKLFSESFLHYPCLVPADGFYEWKEKEPYYFFLKGRKLFFLFSFLLNKESVIVLTIEANELLMPIHHRMPVIGDWKKGEKWLSPGLSMEERKRLCQIFPPEKMEYYPVHPKVNSTQHDGPELIQPFLAKKVKQKFLF
ncbi:MAG: hypothetical protein D6785_00190, partial [Planctomycetota bacterium]